MNLLEQYCQRCMTEGKSQPLKNLVTSAKGIAAIDFSAVYFSLISIYSRLQWIFHIIFLLNVHFF